MKPNGHERPGILSVQPNPTGRHTGNCLGCSSARVPALDAFEQGGIGFWSRFVSSRFVSFRFVSFRFVSLRSVLVFIKASQPSRLQSRSPHAQMHHTIHNSQSSRTAVGRMFFVGLRLRVARQRHALADTVKNNNNNIYIYEPMKMYDKSNNKKRHRTTYYDITNKVLVKALFPCSACVPFFVSSG